MPAAPTLYGGTLEPILFEVGVIQRHGSYRIAEPEKALLDWIYLQRQEGLPTTFDELNLRTIDWKKLHRYALKYPRSVRKALEAAAA